MKRISYIILLLVVLMQMGGLSLFYSAQQYYAQYRMAKAIESDHVELQHLTISAADYQKSIVEDGEIEYNGKRYDVVASNNNAGKVELTVVRDIAEEDIVENIRLISNNAGKRKHDVLNHVMKYVAVINTIAPVYHSPTLAPWVPRIYAAIDEPIVPGYIDTSYPPPWSV